MSETQQVPVTTGQEILDQIQQGQQQRIHELKVEAYLALEKELKEALERFESGDIVVDFLTAANAEEAKTRFLSYKEYLRSLIERHNVALNEAKNAMRALVQLGPTQWRGPEGKADTARYKSFMVSSVTKRSFDAQQLFNLLTRHGALERYMGLTKTDKDGNVVPLIKQDWDIDYEGVLGQLRADGLDDVIQGAYDEKESTPQAKGPKMLTYLGEPKEK